MSERYHPSTGPDPYTSYDAEDRGTAGSGEGRRRGLSRLARVHGAGLGAGRLLRRSLSVDESARGRRRGLHALLAAVLADRAGPKPGKLPCPAPALAGAPGDQRDHGAGLDLVLLRAANDRAPARADP